MIGKLLSANEIDYRNKDCTSSTSMIEIVVVYTKRPDLIDKKVCIFLLRRPSSTPVCSTKGGLPGPVFISRSSNQMTQAQL